MPEFFENRYTNSMGIYHKFTTQVRPEGNLNKAAQQADFASILLIARLLY
jgi:hypothetical protein